MRVVILFRGFAFGGIERYVLAIAEGLSRRGVPWEIWHPDPTFVNKMLARLTRRAVGGSVVALDVAGPADHLWGQFRSARRQFRSLKERFSLLMNESTPGLFAVAAIAGRAAGAHRVVNVTHWIGDDCARNWSGGTLGLWKAHPFAKMRTVTAASSAFVTPSMFAARTLVDWFRVPMRKVHVIPHGVPRPLQAAGGNGGVRELAFLGRLSHEKGLDVLLRALALLPERLPFHLTVAGDGPLRHELGELASELGLNGRVTWLGFCEHITDVLHRADVCVVPSRTESFGLAVVEAMAAGVACVASCTGGIKEMITNGVDGLLVAPDDPQALAERLEALLVDGQMRKALGRAARDTALARYSQRRMIRQTLDLLL
ncbi:MAG TPA: glycosyltransferase family 4 protein [Phycisphaerae bacterium]|nr:glycosyltransferase family 4 protein [Phycisphaerae bacterium]